MTQDFIITDQTGVWLFLLPLLKKTRCDGRLERCLISQMRLSDVMVAVD